MPPAEPAAARIPASPSNWRHWTVWGWCVVVRSYEPSRIEVYDPQGRAMTWALAQRSSAP
jgi:hypothetical protein